MRLPFLEQAIIPRAKVADYLLSPTHPDGRSKALFFERFGFSADAWEVLAVALLRHASEHEVKKVEPSLYGTRYVIEGILQAPDRKTPRVRAVWFIEDGETRPRFVTAYPARNDETAQRT